MRKTAIVSLLAIVPVLASATEYPSYASVTNMWWNGYKTNVLAIAESRLEANTNDIVGIVLKLEYDLSFTYLDDLTNSFPRALDVASRIRTPSFSALYDDFVVSLTSLEEYIRENPLPESALPRERAKGNIIHKRMNYLRYLKALDDDGFFVGNPNEGE